jgi:Na+/proline symporter
VLLVSAGYLVVLFCVAQYGQRRADRGRSLSAGGTIYALSLGVYATTWTYYGSVGLAASSGAAFLPIFLGPTLMFALGWVVLRKIIRICRRHRITSLADFVSARYGNSVSLSALVAVMAVVGVVPYIALQLKAVSSTFELITGHVAITSGASGASGASGMGVSPLADTGLYVALVLAAFAILFGTRHLDATERHEGMILAIAFEAVVKLVIFVAVGFFVTFGMFGGFGRLFARAAAHPATAALFTLGHGSYSTFAWLTALSMLAVLLLPRQWQVSVVENADERHVRRAAWLFPLYLLAINIFVLPIALGGLLRFGSTVNPDTYVLALPTAAGQRVLSLAVFIGGLSAAIGMIIVETIALSTMVSNSLILPLLLRGRSRLARRPDLTGLILGIRRTAIVVIILLGYAYFRLAAQGTALVDIGLVSFVAVAQFAPAVLGGLFWKGGTRNGAFTGLVAGFAVWTYTLLLPNFGQTGLLPPSLLRDGPFGIGLLRPTQLFGLTGLDEVTRAMFWSLLFNVAGYVAVSLAGRLTPAQRSQAAQFVDALAGPATAGRSRVRASVGELRALAERFLGSAAAGKALRARYPEAITDTAGATLAAPELVRYVETLLAGSVGTACARLVVSSVVEEEQLAPDELMTILDEASHVAAAEERNRLARELHDSVSQALFSMTLHTRALELAVQQQDPAQQRPDPQGPVGRNLAELRSLTQNALGEMRALIFQLRPAALSEEGLAAAVRRFAGGVAAREGLSVDADIPEGRLPLDDRTEQELFRIVQEAVQNSVKHARARHLGIRLAADPDATGTLIMEITDDGVGFQPDTPRPGHLGLHSMRERAEKLGGQFIVESSPGTATTVRVILPGILRRQDRSPAVRR